MHHNCMYGNRHIDVDVDTGCSDIDTDADKHTCPERLDPITSAGRFRFSLHTSPYYQPINYYYLLPLDYLLII
jgi:hypothetical protein